MKDVHSQEIITPSLAAAMFFVAFDGWFYLLWGVMLALGLPDASRFGMPPVKIAAVLQMICTPLYLYVIYKGWRAHSFRSFSGLTWPIIILWAVFYYRFLTVPVELSGRMWIVRLCATIIPMIAFSIPMSDKSLKRGLKVLFALLVFTSLMHFLTFYEFMLAGHSARSSFYYKSSLCKKIHFTSMIGSNLIILSSIAACTLGLLVLHCWCKRTFIRWYVVFPLYALGTSILYFGGSRTCVGISVLGSIVILLMSLNKRNVVKLTASALVILALNGMFYKIYETKDRNSVLSRTQEMLTSISTISSILIAENEAEDETTLPFALMENEKGHETALIDVAASDDDEHADVIAGTVPGERVPNKRDASAPRGLFHNIPPLKDIVIDEKPIATFNDYTRLKPLYEESGVDVRTYLYLHTINFVYYHPFGKYTSVPIVLPNGKCRFFDPHASWASTMAMSGIFGFILFAVMGIRGLADSIYLYRNKNELSWIGLFFVVTGLMQWVGTSLTFLAAPFWCLAVLLRAQSKRLQHEPRASLSAAEPPLPETGA